MNEATHTRVAIAGSGPAGLTAAVYAARAQLQPIVFEGPSPGGQLTTTSEIENFPGFPKGVDGPTLMQDMRAQAERFGTRLVSDAVTDVEFSRRPFVLKVGAAAYTADSVIIASGATATWLGLDSEQKLRGHGVSACATCDGFFFRGKELVVAGGGDTAAEEATFLTRFATKVTLVHRRDALRASPFMQQKLRADPKIEFAWDSVIEEVLDVEKKEVTGVRVRNVKTNDRRVIPCQGLFVAIGHKPSTEAFKGKLSLDEHGYIVVEPGSTRTSVPGVFAAGDVADHRYRQAVTAAGTGCMAALDAEAYLVKTA